MADFLEEVAVPPTAKGGITPGHQQPLQLRYDLIGTVNFYVKDYLEKSQLTQSRVAFERECHELELPIEANVESTVEETNEENVVNEKTIERSLEMFDNTYEDAFFKIWDDPSLIPHVHDTSSYTKINFRLHIYFCCRKISENLAPPTDCLQNIRDFFDREGSALSNEQEFIHFFALPFVSNPEEHPTFRILFQETTWLRLRGDLVSYLRDLRLSEQFSSELVKLVLLNSVGSGKELYQRFIMKEQDAQKMRKRYSQLVANHQQLRKDYQKLIAVTKELTTGLEMVARMTTEEARDQSASGQKGEGISSIEWNTILGNCTKIYPELFPPQTPRKQIKGPFMNGNLLQSSKFQPASIKNGIPLQVSRQSSLTEVSDAIQNVVKENRLDFPKIKSQLASLDIPREKLLLLQALRWMLTRSTNGERALVLDSYLESDIFDLSSFSDDADAESDHESKGQDIFLEALLPEQSLNYFNEGQDEGQINEHERHQFARVQQSCIAKLVNAMASIKRGRDYLGGHDPFVDRLIDCLVTLGNKRTLDTVEMVLATLQKLSLKCFIRKRMIERGIIEWLVEYLQVTESHNSYGLEYSTALLMNLCLHKSGKEKCVPIAKSVLDILTKLLSINMRQIYPYVNGALYSLLSNSRIVTQAKEIHLEDRLRIAHQQGDPETKHQLDYILDQLKKHSDNGSRLSLEDDQSTSTISDDEDDDPTIEEDIEIEDEIDSNDLVIHKPGELVGIQLLTRQYVVEERTIMMDVEGNVTASTRKDVYVEGAVQPIQKRNKDPPSEFESPKKMRNLRRNSSHSVTSSLKIEEIPPEKSEPEMKIETENEVEPQTPLDVASSDEPSPESPRKKNSQKDHMRSNIPPALPSNVRYTSGSSWNNVGRKDKRSKSPNPDSQAEGRKSKERASSSSSKDSSSKEKSNSNPTSGNNSGTARELRRRGSYTIIPASSSGGKENPPLNPAIPLPPVSAHQGNDELPKGRRGRDRSKKHHSSQDDVSEHDSISTKTMTVLPPLAQGSDNALIPRPTSSMSNSRSFEALDANGRLGASMGPGSAAEKRTINMSFPYNPLTQIEGYLIASPPSPRKRWKKLPLSISTAELNFLTAISAD